MYSMYMVGIEDSFNEYKGFVVDPRRYIYVSTRTGSNGKLIYCN